MSPSPLLSLRANDKAAERSSVTEAAALIEAAGAPLLLEG